MERTAEPGHPTEPCAACKRPVIRAVNTRTASMVYLDPVPSASGLFSLNPGRTADPIATQPPLKLRFGRTNLYTDHAKVCGSRAGAKPKTGRQHA